ncbi:MAG TPA: DUF1295 domain-containing protein [Spirochaetota bacterium]|nr:DUF1295 domain-containing protein [Spirochaetota bacterium]HPI89917.1 DUF1295 domain-containing protein [Spirochaetota bacterium]HPR49063.1 DUF1295 domain-containing protein [Spirochaetota bacterium]
MNSRKRNYSRTTSLLICLGVYFAAGAAALFTGLNLGSDNAILAAFAADSAATAVVFMFSVIFDNSSLYDPYWSVAPPLIGLYFARNAVFSLSFSPLQWAALGCVALWSVRLTWNWLRNWTGLSHEDWRYLDIAAKTGKLYWPVSFLGIHYFPTVQVFLGCLSLYPCLAAPGTFSVPLGAAAFIVTAGAVFIEAKADRQLLDFVRSGPPKGSIMASGLWKHSRHPNYFGEVSFWWGLFLFGLASGNFQWWTLAGPVLITAMFLFISIPFMDRRMLERRPGYAEHMKKTSALVPLPPFKRG